MLFLMVFGRFPEKFSLGIFFSPSKSNTIRLVREGQDTRFSNSACSDPLLLLYLDIKMPYCDIQMLYPDIIIALPDPVMLIPLRDGINRYH